MLTPDEAEQTLRAYGYHTFRAPDAMLGISSDDVSELADEYLTAFFVRRKNGPVLTDCAETISALTRHCPLQSRARAELQRMAAAHGAELQSDEFIMQLTDMRDLPGRIGAMFRLLKEADRFLSHCQTD